MVLTRFLKEKKKKKKYPCAYNIQNSRSVRTHRMGFYHLLHQTQTEEHIDCSCPGLAQLSTQSELQPLNDVV